MMRLSTLLICLLGGAMTNVVHEVHGVWWALLGALLTGMVGAHTYHEGRRDGVREACDYVEKFAKAQKDRS